MRTWHLDCGTMRPLGGKLINGEGGLLERARLVCHCVVVETERDGLVLIDTGFGEQDLGKRGRIHAAKLALLGARIGPEQPAVRQLARMGYQPSDVRHIVVTHLDLDHVGGLADFPLAEVHVYAAELEAAQNPQTFLDRNRYRPVTWAHRPRWVRHRVEGERWKGFECVRQIQGLPPEILIVPLTGHSKGHCAIAVDTGEGFLLHAGDAYFHAGQVQPEHPFCPRGLELFQQTVADDDAVRRENLERLRDLVREHGHEVRVFSAHDPDELDRQRRRG